MVCRFRLFFTFHRLGILFGCLAGFLLLSAASKDQHAAADEQYQCTGSQQDPLAVFLPAAFGFLNSNSRILRIRNFLGHHAAEFEVVGIVVFRVLCGAVCLCL